MEDRNLQLNDEETTLDAETGFVIRPATRADMPQIAEFVRSSADWYREIIDEADMAEHDVDEEWQARNFVRRDFYVGCADGEDVGTISVQYFGGWAYLGYIYLDVSQVGKGYGHRLMEFAEQCARKEGADGLCLIAHPEAKWAKKAYLKYGFEITRRDREHVLAWNDGALQPYYEEGFELYQLPFSA